MGGGADDVVGLYRVGAAGKAADGARKLRVTDNAAFDTGTTNSWVLLF